MEYEKFKEIDRELSIKLPDNPVKPALIITGNSTEEKNRFGSRYIGINLKTGKEEYWPMISPPRGDSDYLIDSLKYWDYRGESLYEKTNVPKLTPLENLLLTGQFSIISTSKQKKISTQLGSNKDRHSKYKYEHFTPIFGITTPTFSEAIHILNNMDFNMDQFVKIIHLDDLKEFSKTLNIIYSNKDFKELIKFCYNLKTPLILKK